MIKITLEFEDIDDAHYILYLYRFLTLARGQDTPLDSYETDRHIVGALGYVRDLIENYTSDKDLRKWMAEMSKYDRAFIMNMAPSLKEVWPKEWDRIKE